MKEKLCMFRMNEGQENKKRRNKLILLTLSSAYLIFVKESYAI